MVGRSGSLDAVPAGLRGAVVAIGSFDGVHRGHQAILATMLAEARSRGTPSVVLTLDAPPLRLTPPLERSLLLRALGASAILSAPPGLSLDSTEADTLVDSIVEALAPSVVVLGHDTHFGPGHEGSAATLERAGENAGFEVIEVEAARDAPYATSAAIAALSTGDVHALSSILGYRWFTSGEVVHGDKRGRVLGFPTANIVLPAATPLRHGIYAVRVRRQNGDLLDGVASFGIRPTFGNGPALLEVFLFGFSGDLYGERLRVSFIGWVRPEERFENVEALVARIREDELAARAILASAGPGSSLDGTLATLSNS